MSASTTSVASAYLAILLTYARFLQADRSSRDRLDIGLEVILREVFPIESYYGQFRLEYIRYELGKPRYTPEECRSCA